MNREDEGNFRYQNALDVVNNGNGVPALAKNATEIQQTAYKDVK